MQRLASALVRLKGIFPTANAALLIARRPFLALHEDLTAVAAAGLELRDMLPGVDVDRRAPLSISPVFPPTAVINDLKIVKAVRLKLRKMPQGVDVTGALGCISPAALIDFLCVYIQSSWEACGAVKAAGLELRGRLPGVDVNRRAWPHCSCLGPAIPLFPPPILFCRSLGHALHPYLNPLQRMGQEPLVAACQQKQTLRAVSARLCRLQGSGTD